MKKQSGFTLIELVIVIIILGILAATAVPKFVDMQGDARQAAMKGLKGALEGAATLTYSRAAIDGHEGNTAAENAKLTPAYKVNGAVIAFGYPAATSAALSTVAGLAETDWTFSAPTNNTITITAEGTTGQTGTGDKACNVTYKEGTASARPEITVHDGGC